MNIDGTYLVVYLFIFALLALIPATIAKSKGHSFWAFWVFGVVLWLVAVIWAAVMKPEGEFARRQEIRRGARACPHCDELVRPNAKVCPHCQREIVE